MVAVQKRIPWSRVGAYLSEFNLRFINKTEPFPELLVRTVRENYVEVFNEKHYFHFSNLCYALL